MRRRALALAGAGAFAYGCVAQSEERKPPRLKRTTTEMHDRPIELLVHNISHSDMLIALSEEADKERGEHTHMARPIFNKFQPTSEAILQHIRRLQAAQEAPVVVDAQSKYQVRYPVGFDLSSRAGGELDGAPLLDEGGSSAGGAPAQSISDMWDRFHLKGIGSKRSFLGIEGDDSRESPRLIGQSAPRIMTVYFPLIAVLIPEWLRVLKRREGNDPARTAPKKVLVLVSGAGQPRNPKANPQDNSTEGTGQIIAQFVQRVYPDIEVRHISSSSLGIFRYDDNVRFVKEEVLPLIDRQRTLALQTYGEHWPSNLRVTLCLADGPPARISALNTSLRSYRPDYLHVWRLKTFWDERVLSEEDVEFHTFKKLEMRPPVHRSQLTGDLRMLVDDMIRYRRQFEAIREVGREQAGGGAGGVPAGGKKAGGGTPGHELDTFWLRKTKKVVMAVLLTKKSDDDPAVFWRGMNVEVSMPTGTLCAERNAIGNALAGDQTMCRKHIQGVAVLSMNLDKEDGGGGEDDGEVALNPLDPCGACMEWLKKIGEVNPDFKVVTFANTNCNLVYVRPIGDYG